jgi:hypothetical protein
MTNGPFSLNLSAQTCPDMVRIGPYLARMGPHMVRVEFERREALELLGMTLAHLREAENKVDLSPRVPLLLVIRDKLALGLREDT